MIKKLTAICLLLSQVSLAQFKPQPTPFDKFINQPKIEWAAYASDTFNFNNGQLNELLLKRFTANKIKASLPVESRTTQTNNIIYKPIDSVNNIILYRPDDYVMDAEGNTILKKNQLQKIDSSLFKITETTQILYIENGILKSYIPFVTPTIPVFMSTGKYIGERFYFTSCYNYKYNYKSRKKNKVIFLQQTSKRIRLDSADTNNQLKELYGKNMLETLWPYVLENKFTIFAIDSNKQIEPKDIESQLGFTQPIIVPLYDSTGTVYAYNILEGPFSKKHFTNATLLQDWYYDETKNIVFNKIKEMILYINKSNNDAVEEPVPVIKLVFK
jgi:hypothetical protein